MILNKKVSIKEGEEIMNMKRRAKIKNLLRNAAVLVGVSAICTEVFAAINLDEFGKAISTPMKKFMEDYYPVGILVAGSTGAFLQRDGDLKERSIGFGKGVVAGGLVMLGAKAMLGI